MSWKPDTRHERTIGPYTLCPERNKDNETAHRVSFPDGRGLRVLPDDRISGQKRSRVIVDALTQAYCAAPIHRIDLEEVAVFDPMVYLVGALAGAGLTWELLGVVREVSIEEWLEHYFVSEMWDPDSADPLPHWPDEVRHFLKALEDDGWAIVRGETE